MSKINKIDYFVGVFISTILNSTKNKPALFDETNDSKKVQFESNKGLFNVYVKYSTKRNESDLIRNKKKINKISWTVNFTQNEYEVFKKFYSENYKNCIAIVCTNDKFSETWVAVFDYETATACLNKATAGGNRRITVIRYGKAKQYKLTGVEISEDAGLTCPFDYASYFN